MAVHMSVHHKLWSRGFETDPPANSPASAVTTIRPAVGWEGIDWRELWGYRELLYFLTWRDIQVRYKQTVLGIIWAVLQPVATMAVFTVFFGRLGGMPSYDVPYAVFAMVALVPWVFFANALTQTTNSVVDSAHLITKVYFPRLVVPIATVLAGLVDFALAFVVLMGMLLAYGIVPGVRLLVLPVLVLIAVMTTLGAGLWLSALNVQFRDVRYAVPFVSQIWLLASPVAYPSSLLPLPWRLVYAANPMVGVVEGFRWVLLGVPAQPLPMIGVSLAAALVGLVTGTYFFRRTEQGFADMV